MRREKISCIYEIRNTVNNKHYVGSAVDFEVRKKGHLNGLRKQKHHSRYLQSAFNKYGECAFVFNVLEVVNDKTKLIEREQFWMDYTSPAYNIAKVAGSTLGVRFTDEAKKNVSNAVRASMTEDVRRKIGKQSKRNWEDPEFRATQFFGSRGWCHTEESKKKMSESTKGQIHSDEAKKKISDSRKNVTYSEDAKRRISESVKARYEGGCYEGFSFKGRSHSEESKEKISTSLRTSEKVHTVPVVQLQRDGRFAKTFSSVTEASYEGFLSSKIVECCRGTRKSHKGYRFVYKKDYDFSM